MIKHRYVACIDACNDCALACSNCVNACFEEDPTKTMMRCLALDIDCAAVCQLAAAAMARNSEFAADLCALCAKICGACATECAKHDTAHCQRCSEACRLCAEECRRVA